MRGGACRTCGNSSRPDVAPDGMQDRDRRSAASLMNSFTANPLGKLRDPYNHPMITLSIQLRFEWPKPGVLLDPEWPIAAVAPP